MHVNGERLSKRRVRRLLGRKSSMVGLASVCVVAAPHLAMAQFASNNAAGAAAASATGANSSAGGFGSSATGAGSTVVGNGSTDNGNAGAVAVGQNASVLGTGSIAIGQGVTSRSSATQQGVIDYRNGGNSAIVNTGAANATPSGVAIGQASTVNTGGGVALGYNNVAGSTTGFASTAIGDNNLASGGYSTALGVNNQATSTGAIAIGVNNTASGLRAIALGRQSYATGDLSIAQGFVASSYGANSVAIGANSVAGVTGNTAILNDVALGSAASATGGNSVALGPAATVTAAGGVALGAGSTADRLGLRGALEAFSNTPVASTNGAVSVGSAGGERQIINVAGGTQDTDAVNLRQLRAVGTNLAGSLGGGAAFDPTTGAYTAPNYAVNGTTYTNVSGAITALAASSGAFASNNTAGAASAAATGANASAGGYGASATGAASTVIGNGATDNGNANAVALGNGARIGAGLTGSNVALGQGSAVTANAVGTTGATIGGTAYTFAGGVPAGTVSVGTAGAERTITNVAAGRLSGASTDAVNGSQLFATNTQVTTNSTAIAGLASGASGTIQRGAAANQLVAVAAGGTAAAPGAAQTLTNIGPGALTTTSTDAVNGAQLNATNTNATTLGSTIAARLGGGATYSTAGGLTAPSYSVFGAPQASVGGAIAALQTGAPVQFSTAGGVATPSTPGNDVTLVGAATGPVGLHNVAAETLTATSTDAVNGSQLFATNQQVAGLANGTVGLVQQDPATRALTVGAGTDGTSVGFANNAGTARVLTGVGAGQVAVGSTQAINGGQLAGTAGSVATALGGGAGVNADGTISAPSYNLASGTYTNVGSALTALDTSIATGQMGAFRSDNTAGAAAPAATGANSTAGGFGASATGAGSTALGNNATDTGNANATVIGSNGSVTQAGGVALGAGSTATRAGLAGAAEAFSGTAVASTQGAVSVGAAGAERQIINVAGGTQDTDAVNVRQLRATGNTLATSLGGGAGFDPTTNAYTAPAYAVGGQTYNNVGAALAAGNALSVQYTANGAGGATNAIDLTKGGTLAPVTMSGLAPGALTAASTDAVNGSQLFATNQQVAGLANGTAGLVQQDPATRALTVGAGTDGASVGFANNAGAARTLTGVGAGQVAVGSTQAINGGQLAGTAGSVATALGGGAGVNADGTISAPSYTLASGTYTNVGAALTALDTSIVNAQGGAFVGDNTAGRAAPSATGADAVAGGFGASATGAASTVVGNNATDNGAANATVLGSNGSASQAGGVALGSGAVASRAGLAGATEAFSGTAVASTQGAVSVGAVGAERQIINVAGGTQDTDAVNVRQLRATGNTLAASLGGGAGFDPTTNTYTAPAYAVGGQTYASVGAALAAGNALSVQYTADGAGAATNAIDLTKGGALAPVTMSGLANGALTATSTEAVNGSQLFATNQQVAGLTNGTAGLVQQDPATRALTVGAGTDGTSVGFANNAGAARTLTGVGAGQIAVGSTEAINGGQLAGTAGSVAAALGGGATVNPDGTISAPSYNVANGTYTNIGSALTALNDSVASGQAGAFRSDNNAGAAAPVATGANSTAGGFGASATGAGSTALGNGATDNGNANATVVGNGAGVAAGLAGSNVALGSGSLAARGAETNYIGYGVGTQTSVGEVAVGTPTAARTITGVAAGRLPTDAANVAQVQAVGGNLAGSLGGGAAFDPTTGAYTAPSYTVNGATYDNVGSAIAALGTGVGGSGAFASNNAAGAGAPISTGANSTAGGFGASATGAGSTALGNGATDHGNANATVVGNGASVAAGLAGSNVALGQGSTAARGAQTNYGAFGLAAPQNSAGEVAVGSAAASRQITGVAAGSADTDAVNVAQLRGTASDLGTSTATALGGGATYDATTGQVTAPSYSLANGTVVATNVGDALTNIDGRTTANTNAIAGLQNGTSGIVQQAGAGTPITVGAQSGGTSVGFANNAGAARTLTGVAAGQVAAGSTQAVNGGQLYGTATSVASALGGGAAVNADGTVSAPRYSVNGTAYNNVGGAITALDSTGVKYDAAPGGGRGQSITLAGGDPNQPVVIHNVAAGTARTDAANLGQVQDAEAQANQYTNSRLANIQNDMSNVNNRLDSLSQGVEQAKQDAHTAAAVGLAAASLHFDDRPGKFSVAAGGGLWKGSTAGAFGAGYTMPDGRFRLNATAATDGRDVGAAGGLSYTFN